MRKGLFTAGVVVVALVSGVAAGQSRDRARRFYEDGLAEGDARRRAVLLERSFEEYASYEAAIAMGEMLLAEGEWERARPWLDSAYRLSAAGAEARARALFRLAETYAVERRPVLYVEYLRLSLAAYRTPMVEEALLEAMEERRLVSSAEIVEALTPVRTMGASPRPRIDLTVNFEFDSARLTRAGREQARELGDALRGGVGRVLLVGHTDAQGSRAYNEALSRRRAAALRDFMVDEFGLDPRNVDVDGRGEDDLLFTETTDAAHRLNRRVEVILRR